MPCALEAHQLRHVDVLCVQQNAPYTGPHALTHLGHSLWTCTHPRQSFDAGGMERPSSLITHLQVGHLTLDEECVFVHVSHYLLQTLTVLEILVHLVDQHGELYIGR